MIGSLHVPGLGAVHLPRFLRSTTLDQKVIDYLCNAHAQEVAQRLVLPALAGSTPDGDFAAALQEHEAQTRSQAERLEQRLAELGHAPSRRKVAQATAAAVAKPVLDVLRRDRAGKVVRDAFIMEGMEVASYALLEQLALLGGDLETAGLARSIRTEEESFASRVDAAWDTAIELTLDAHDCPDRQVAARHLLLHYLDTTYVMERNVMAMLGSVHLSTEHPRILERVDQHLDHTHEHATLLDERLRQLDVDRSTSQRVVATAFALVKGPINELRSDKDGKNARDLYTVQAMQVAAYELLGRLARVAGDQRTASLVADILAQEHAMATWISGNWPRFIAEDARRQQLDGVSRG